MSKTVKKTVSETIAEIESAPEAKLSGSTLAALWQKIEPLLSMVGMIFGKKVQVYITAFEAAIDSLIANGG